MKRLVLGLAIVLVAVCVLVGATVGPAESAGAKLEPEGLDDLVQCGHQRQVHGDEDERRGAVCRPALQEGERLVAEGRHSLAGVRHPVRPATRRQARPARGPSRPPP